MNNKINSAEILIERGDNKYSNDDVNGAILDYSAAIEVAPEYYLSYLKIAQAKCTSNDVGLMLEAYADFSKAIELNPTSAEAYEGRGALAMSLSPDDPACQNDLDKALELKSDNSMSYWNIGISKLQSNDFEGMLVAFTQFLKCPIDDKDKGEALYFKALANMRLENYSTAIINFTEAIKNRVTQNFVWTYYNRAICHQRINKLNEALDDINSFIELKPNHIDGLQIRAKMYSVLNRDDDAIKDFTNIIELDNANKDALIQRSKIFFMSGLDDDALKDYLTLISLDPKDEIYPFSAGVCLTQLERFHEAINYYNIAIRINNKYAAAYHYRGLSHLYLSNDQACIDLRSAYNLGFESSKEYMDKYCEY